MDEQFEIDASGPTANQGQAEVIEVAAGYENDISPPRGHPFPIVGIGGSAGGLDAFSRFLKALPGDTGMAFVFVQHLDPHHTSQLPEILSAVTPMRVVAAEEGMAISPNTVFVIPPNATMILEDGKLRLSQRRPGLHLPIDAFFESLARVQGGRAIAVVLSGNASDGSLGVRAIKEECGLTFAQDDASAQHVGMPRNAIATGAIDYILSPEDIAKELGRLSQHPFVRVAEPNNAESESLPGGAVGMAHVFQILRTRTRVDFSHYKPNTMRRRIGRRMIVKRIKSLAEYVRLLEKQPDEVMELYRDLLISVTAFFRDQDVYSALSGLLRSRVAARDVHEPFRVWVPGCATGEEVYSLAICLKELLEDLELNTSLQIFGTDISEVALDSARSGTYPASISQDVSEERLRRYFVRSDRGFQVSKGFRELCIFARQDVTSDPPFGHTDLISCRNLLIYLDAVLQNKVFPIFHYSLNIDGLLLLGTAESVTSTSDLFTVLDKQHRIYTRKPVSLKLGSHVALPGLSEKSDSGRVQKTLSGTELQRKADLIIQSKYSPSAVVIDANLQILHFRGRTGFYLDPPPGEATFDLLRMAREGLKVPLRRVISAAAKQDVCVQETGISIEYRGERREINIEVTPIVGPKQGERYFIVVFEEVSTPAIHSAPPSDRLATSQPRDSAGSSTAEVRELEKQVADLRELLRNANEDHEASSEELRASNEEVRSANEELQSTNEELSTTKEELQSANEELTTMNEELQTRNREMNTVNSDLINLLSAVDVAFLIVDSDLRLRRFSAAAERVLGLKSIDIGHPLTHLDGQIHLIDFPRQMRSVVDSLKAEQREIQDKDGHWFSATIRPYRTVDDRIAGAVVVFIDIDPLKRSLRAAEEARDFAEGMVETVREPLLVLDGDLRIQRATSAFYEMFHVARGETEGRLLYDIGNGQWNIPRLRELLGAALFGDDSFHDFEAEHDFPHVGRRTMRLNGRRITREGEDRRIVLLAVEDVTQRREEAEIRYHRLFETAKDGMLVLDGETEKVTDVNPFFLEWTGHPREKFIGLQLPDLAPFSGAIGASGIVSETRSQEIVRYNDVPLSRVDGERIDAELVANRYLVGGRPVVQINARDVTLRNKAVRSLRESEQRFRLFVDSVRDYALFQMDLNGRITSWNSGAERLLGHSESQIIGRLGAVVFTPEDIAAGQPEREMETAKTQGGAEDELWHIRRDGSRFFASGVLTTVRDESGQLRGFAKVMRDVTDRRTAEQQLKQQAALLELAQDLIIVRRLDGAISFWNRAAAETYGWSKEEAAGQPEHVLLNTQFPEPQGAIEATLISQGRWEGELVQTRRNNTDITAWSRWALQVDSEGAPAGVLEINSDITARKHADRQLQASLREKEVLLKEIHHRVKNNLQIIASLLNLQAEYLADEGARTMLEEMNTRVRSIAAIHETLYEAEDLSRIDFGRYLNNLAKDIASVYSDRSSRVNVTVNAKSVVLDITQAVPCGLIVNELLTNSFKHAFVPNQRGNIDVSFHCDGQVCVLGVADDGKGFPADLDPERAVSMGLQLLSLLVRQLKGTLEISRDAGSRFTFTFPRKS